MEFSSVLTVTELEFSRTSLWFMVSILDYYITFHFSVSQMQGYYVNRSGSVQEWRVVIV